METQQRKRTKERNPLTPVGTDIGKKVSYSGAGESVGECKPPWKKV